MPRAMQHLVAAALRCSHMKISLGQGSHKTNLGSFILLYVAIVCFFVPQT